MYPTHLHPHKLCHVAISLGLPEKFHPGNTFKYLKRKFGKLGKEERSFRADWCQKYPWIHYDATKDAAFCYVCMSTAHEGKFVVSTKRDPAFLARGFIYWKEATVAFNKHQSSDCHMEAEAMITLLN